MTIKQLCDRLRLNTITGETEGKEFSGVYTGDMLSRALNRIVLNNLWITIMTNRNVIAVAESTGAAAIVLAEGTALKDDALLLAKQHGITVLSSELSEFELSSAVSRVCESS